MGTRKNIYGTCIGHYLGTIWELYGNCENTRDEPLPPLYLTTTTALPSGPWRLRRSFSVPRRSLGARERLSQADCAQDHGTAAMQEWVHANQRKLKGFLEDAWEWADARERAHADREPDWQCVCRHADMDCPHGDACEYAAMAQKFFEANEGSLSRDGLAAALRAIIRGGPSKTRLTPMLLGPSNTGKSTLLGPFDQVFGHSCVFHKPALKSRYPLRNILENKRPLAYRSIRQPRAAALPDL